MKGFWEEVSLELHLNRRVGAFQAERGRRLLGSSMAGLGISWAQKGLGRLDVARGVVGQTWAEGMNVLPRSL